jgi:pilus assembly protein CpaF
MTVPAPLLTSIRDELVATASTGSPVDRDRLHEAVRRRSAGLEPAAVLELLRGVEAELTGAGPLAAVLASPDVTDVLVNRPDAVWADRGSGLQRVDVRFRDEEEVRRLAVRLAGAAGRRLDVGSPYVDAQLPGGIRLHAVLPPIAVDGTCLSLRLHREAARDIDFLTAAGSLHPSFAAVLDAMLVARLTLVISGGAGSGKTTLLGALLPRISAAERIVIVEDASEIPADHPHLVRLQARPANVEGAGEITLRDLVREALRMRPDRLIVGEVRGVELLDLLLAANTGHDGGLTTLHANGVADVPARIEALAMLAGIGRAAAHSLLGSALQAAVHLRRTPGGLRFVADIAVLRRSADGFVTTVPALSWTGGPEQAHVHSGSALLGQLLLDRGVAPPSCLRPA